MLEQALESLVADYQQALMAFQAWRPSRGDYFDYPPELNAFMGRLQESPWVRYDYEPHQAVAIEQRLDQATLDDICCLLTAWSRAERFCDGAWYQIFEEQRLELVLWRLQVLIGRAP